MKRAAILNREDVGMILLSLGFLIGMVMLAGFGFFAFCAALMWWPVSIGIASLLYAVELVRFCWAAVWH